MKRKENVVNQKSKIDAIATVFGDDPAITSSMRAEEMAFIYENFYDKSVQIPDEEVNLLLEEVSEEGIFLTFMDDGDEIRVQKLIQLTFQTGIRKRLLEAEREFDERESA